jgi:serine/threonine protein kinase
VLTWARYADMVGTLVYMAPELMRRQASSPASDVFSLAICLNEMLTGCVPYSDVRSLCCMLGDSLHLGRLFLGAHPQSPGKELSPNWQCSRPCTRHLIAGLRPSSCTRC